MMKEKIQLLHLKAFMSVKKLRIGVYFGKFRVSKDNDYYRWPVN